MLQIKEEKRECVCSLFSKYYVHVKKDIQGIRLTMNDSITMNEIILDEKINRRD